MKIIGYLRVSTTDQAGTGHGLDAQRAAIQAEADRRGWTVTWIEDTGSGGHLRRDGLQAALSSLDRHEHDGLVVARLDRLSRSVVDFGNLLRRAERQGWHVVALDLGVDTSNPTGELMANVLIAVAQWERKMIGLRTKEGLAAAKAKGVRLGGPVLVPVEVEQRIVALRAEGLSFAKIATTLNDDGVPCSGRGRAWYPATVAKVVRRSVVPSAS